MTKMRGWYLEHRSDGHRKFYLIIIGDDGTYHSHWGRIGTNGQHAQNNFASLHEAEAMAHKTRYAKMAKGYQMVHEGIEFNLDTATLDNLRHGVQINFAERPFWDKIENAKVATTEQLADAYEAFLDDANRILDQLSSSGYDNAAAEFHKLDELWDRIKKMHEEAETVMTLAQMSAGSSLMSP